MEFELTGATQKNVAANSSNVQIAQTKNTISTLLLIKNFFSTKTDEKNYNPLPVEEGKDSGEHHGFYGRLRYQNL